MELHNEVETAFLNEAGIADKLFKRLNELDRKISELGMTSSNSEAYLSIWERLQTIENSINRLELTMADVNAVLEAFRAAVDKELLDDKAQNDLIAILQANEAVLQGQVADAEALVASAVAGEAAAKAEVDRLLAVIEEQTGRLGENDAPQPELPGDVEVPAEPEAPVEPETPVTEPEAPVDEPVTEPEAPVDVEVPTEPEAPVEPTEEPVTEPEAPAEDAPAQDNPEAPADGETGFPNPFSI